MTSPSARSTSFTGSESGVPDSKAVPSRAYADRPIVVATDASATADAAFVMARALAHRSGAPVDVVTVLETSPAQTAAAYPVVIPIDIPADRMEKLRARARHQLEGLIGETTGWTVDVRSGEPAPTIHRRARELEAELVIMGVSRHGIMDRLYGEETTAHMAELTATPLLAVVAGGDRLPRTIVVAVNAESTAIPESSVLRTLLSEAETVHLVTVRPDTTEFPPVPPFWDPLYFDDVRDACQLVQSSLDLPPGVFRAPVVLSGNPAKAILSFAKEAGADLIIVGQQRGLLRRWIGASLAVRLLRGTTCSLLVLPRPHAARRHAAPPATTSAGVRTATITDRAVWAARLDEISTRNAGRRVMLEVDDPALGAQIQATDYPFLGADYDHTDDRIGVMLGNPSGGMSHLTHFVIAPTSVDIVETDDRRTLVVRIENETAQTLVRFLT